MTTIQVRIPKPLLLQAQMLAAQENMPVDQLLSLAVTQAIGAWSNKGTIAPDARSASRAQFLEMLEEALSSNRSNYYRRPPGSLEQD